MYSFSVVNIIFSIISGILLFFSFPKFGKPVFAWFCLSFLFCSIIKPKNKIKDVILYSLICGIVGYSGIFYWIIPTFKVAGENVILGGISVFLLSLYFTLFLCIFCLYLWLTKNQHIIYIISASSLWVMIEYLTTYLLSGFPWVILGNTQYSNVKLIQIADVAGVYGISFILVFSNLVISCLINSIIEKKFYRSTIVNIVCLTVLLSISYFYGKIKFDQKSEQMDSLVVVLLQGNVDQYKKWDKHYVKEIMDKYTKLVKQSCELLKHNFDKIDTALFIWPESSIPGWLFEENFLYDWVSELVQYTNSKFCSYHLIGTVRMGKTYSEYYNSAVLFSVKDGKVCPEQIYDKIHLVPFGEYVPFRKFLSKFVKTMNDLGEFTPGKNFTVFNLTMKESQHNLNFSTLICYESIFSLLTTKFVSSGAKFLVNITNDAWFLTTSAPYQHFIPNIFRAIENRCFVLRCANTGISCIISPTGEVITQTQLFKDEMVVYKIKLYYRKTFYTKFSKYLWLVYFILFLLTILIAFVHNSKPKNYKL